MTSGELWLRLPVVDRETGNWSLTRTGALVALWCWCDVSHRVGFSWAGVAVLAIIAVLMLAKNIADLKAGFGAVGNIFPRRRITDQRDAVREAAVDVVEQADATKESAKEVVAAIDKGPARPGGE